MRMILGWLGATLAGWLGWWLGSFIGFATAMLVSVLAGAFGLYLGFRWFDQNLK